MKTKPSASSNNYSKEMRVIGIEMMIIYWQVSDMAGVAAAITGNSRICYFISPCCILDAGVISNIQPVSQIPVIYQFV